MSFKKKIEGIDYEFMDDDKTYVTTPIKILQEPYEGVIILFGKVSFEEDETLFFRFNILSEDKFLKTVLMNDTDFKERVYQILTSILIDDTETA